MSELDPTPEIPDDTPISDVEFPARIRNVLAAAGLKTAGEVRDIRPRRKKVTRYVWPSESLRHARQL